MLPPQERPAFQGLYVGNSTVLTTLASGQSVFVDGRDISLAPHVMRDGRWEHWIARHWTAQLRAGHSVVDVGANFGYYTLLAADAVGPGGRVATFEPNPRMFELLTASVAINGYRGRVQVHQVALDEQEGTVTFWAKDRETGGSSLHQPSDVSLTALHDSATSMQVQAVTLDAVLADWECVHLLKLDAEGGRAEGPARR